MKMHDAAKAYPTLLMIQNNSSFILLRVFFCFDSFEDAEGNRTVIDDSLHLSLLPAN
jgi:hypothetical protein